jgi:uncharacterized peroxidase-related enzyme
MSDFPLHTIDTAPADSRPVLQATAQAYGFVPNLHAMLAESPQALQALDSLFALIGSSGLTPQEQQTAMLAVSVYNSCGYCVAGHSFVARSVQLDETALQALRHQQAITRDTRLQALRGFTEAVLSERGRAGGAPLAALLAAGYTRQNALEVLTIVAAKTLSNYANNLAQTPPDAFMADPQLRWLAPGRSA